MRGKAWCQGDHKWSPFFFSYFFEIVLFIEKTIKEYSPGTETAQKEGKKKLLQTAGYTAQKSNRKTTTKTRNIKNPLTLI